MSKNKLRSGLCGLLAIFALSFPVLAEEQPQDLLLDALDAPDSVNYKTEQVRRGDFIKNISAAATLFYPRRSTLFIEEGNARFVENLVSRGDKVKAGDPLVRYERMESQAEYQEKLLSAQRLEEKMRSEREQGARAIQRAQQQSAGLTGSEAQLRRIEIEKMKLQLERSQYADQAQLEDLQREIGEMARRMEQQVVVAPFDGVVDQVSNKNEGDTIWEGEGLAVVYSEEEVLLEIPDSSGRLRMDMEVSVEIGRNDNKRVYPGKIVMADNALPFKVHSGKAYVQMLERPEKFGTMKAITVVSELMRLEDVLLANRRAFTMEKGNQAALILNGDMVQKRYALADYNNGEDALVLMGLEEGQTLILE
jgi:biotin carboxyl carrier protein